MYMHLCMNDCAHVNLFSCARVIALAFSSLAQLRFKQLLFPKSNKQISERKHSYVDVLLSFKIHVL